MEDGIGDEDEGEVQNAEVKRELKQRHIGMIALGGTIGTGLFIGLSTPGILGLHVDLMYEILKKGHL